MAAVPYNSFVFLYVLAMAVSGFLALLKRSEKFGIVISVALVLLLLLSRNPTAPTDFISYQQMYARSDSIYSALGMYHENYAFSLLMWAGNALGISYDGFSIILSILVTIAIFLCVSTVASKTALLIFILLYGLSSSFVFLSVNVVRQGLALAFVYAVVCSGINRKWCIAILFSFAAFFSHDSAIIPVIAAWLGFVLCRVEKGVLLSLVFIPAGILGAAIIQPLAEVLGGDIFQRFLRYVDYDYENMTFIARRILLVIGAASFCLYISVYGELQREKKILSIFLNILCVATVLLSVSPLSSSRVMYYGTAFFPLVAAIWFEHFVNNFGRGRRVAVYGLGMLGVIAYGMVTYYHSSVMSQLA